jgi:hypothetical protein
MSNNNGIGGLAVKYAYKRKIYVPLLFFLLITLLFRTFALTYHDFPDYVSKDSAPVIRLVDNEFNDSLLLLPRTNNRDNYSDALLFNSIFISFRSREFVFVLLLTLQIILFDRRKQIITLILQHFEGGKYKHELSVLYRQ